MGTARVAEAVELMTRFAERTGLTSDRPAHRYLWTDAFAVCNFLGLDRATGDSRWTELALRLVDQVHRVLGRYHANDSHRSGWISGLSDAEAQTHPTIGGLRIGKPMAERAATDPLEPDLEWDRDGQYFHYLTKWMHALDQIARWTGQSKYEVWARELARAAHRAFTYGTPGNRRMVWKLSIDLSRPQVASMGQHDALDGFVTYTQLETTAAALRLTTGPHLATAVTDFAEMRDRQQLETSDPLGLGGLLVDACRLVQLDAGGELVATLLAASVLGLERYLSGPDLRAAAHRRLAFRELGLAIGLSGVSMLESDLVHKLNHSAKTSLAELAECLPLRTEIESFWSHPPHRRTSTWIDHIDINEVMLSTSLAPDGFLELTLPQRR